jgi:methylated-DNA-[protein]-cysteine S-methyltransferase
MMHSTFVIGTPIGRMAATISDGALLALRFVPPDLDAPATAHTEPLIQRLQGQLAEYFEGRRREFSIPLRLEGTPFQRRVWASLCEIPYGQTRSYGEQARSLGQPNAARAVGLANGQNPIAVLVPCHRVIGAKGSLTGYAGGVALKAQLLVLEGALTMPVAWAPHAGLPAIHSPDDAHAR